MEEKEREEARRKCVNRARKIEKRIGSERRGSEKRGKTEARKQFERES